MAEHLASIFGTERDKVNCPFYFKIGACRHGDHCSRVHNRPPVSQTVLFKNMYSVPITDANGMPIQHTPESLKEHFENYFEDVYDELAKFGKVEEMVVCRNHGEHLLGNLYVKYEDEEGAEKALQALSGRFYAGRDLRPEYSPVTDFRESMCKDFGLGRCARGDFCNFMHAHEVSPDIYADLFDGRKQYDAHEDADRRRGGHRGGPPRSYDYGGHRGGGRDYHSGGGRREFRSYESRDHSSRSRSRDSRSRDYDRYDRDSRSSRGHEHRGSRDDDHHRRGRDRDVDHEGDDRYSKRAREEGSSYPQEDYAGSDHGRGAPPPSYEGSAPPPNYGSGAPPPPPDHGSGAPPPNYGSGAPPPQYGSGAPPPNHHQASGSYASPHYHQPAQGGPPPPQ
mmetsp:Transcript_3652/g.11354  ORF Transcript_3652/g.11354 Transcript_3652/m.11354 type:complete len:394 (-) Transcript_3652:27-1208(-)